jgi:hypothetical protein
MDANASGLKGGYVDLAPVEGVPCGIILTPRNRSPRTFRHSPYDDMTVPVSAQTTDARIAGRTAAFFRAYREGSHHVPVRWLKGRSCARHVRQSTEWLASRRASLVVVRNVAQRG